MRVFSSLLILAVSIIVFSSTGRRFQACGTATETLVRQFSTLLTERQGHRLRPIEGGFENQRQRLAEEAPECIVGPFHSVLSERGGTVCILHALEQEANGVLWALPYHPRRLRPVGHLLGRAITAQLVERWFVLSRLDYCNVILTRLSDVSIRPLQRVLNTAARVVLWQGPRDSAKGCEFDSWQCRILYHIPWS